MRTSTVYGLAHTKTFRRNSKKMLGGQGGNLQNWEKSMRAIAIPDGFSESLKEKCLFYLKEGDYSVFTEEELVSLRIFAQVDQSGAEALIVAYECEKGNYRKLFENNIKPHVFVALKLFKDVWPLYVSKYGFDDITAEVISELDSLPIESLRHHIHWKTVDKLIKDSDNWSIQERYYYFAKQTCHSANYGIETNTFILNVLDKSGGKVVLSQEQGNYFLKVYRALFPEIVDRCARIAKQAEMTKILYNLHGHPYQITSYDILPSDLKELYAWTAQSTVAEITRIAYTNMQNWIEESKKKVDLLADTHDSYLVQCRLFDVVETSRKMKEFINQKLISPIDGTEFSMKSECKIGFNWSDEKKDINPLGLREVSWNN